MRTRLLALVLLLATTLSASAQEVRFDPRVGAVLPMDVRLQDETDHPVQLSTATGGHPWILTLGYFSCPNLCDTVRADLIGALKSIPANLPYRVVAISVDTREGVADVNQARIHDATYQSRSDAWRYLRADAATLAALTQAVGFTDRYDRPSGQIAHPAGVVFVTPDGRISSYLLGVGYRSEDVARALDEAAQGHFAAAPPPAIALLCFDYDAATGRYSFAIIKVLRILAIVTVLLVAGMLACLFLRPRVAA